jgi:hypothetical protein
VAASATHDGNAILPLMSAAIRRAFLIAVFAGFLPGPAATQERGTGAMVVIVNSDDTYYHQPGCPVVAKAGSKVRVAKTSEATRKGLKPHPACADGGSDAAREEAAADFNNQKVYTQKDDNKYHRKECKKLVGDPIALTLDDAGQKLWPCPVCKPPIRKRTTGQQGS